MHVNQRLRQVGAAMILTCGTIAPGHAQQSIPLDQLLPRIEANTAQYNAAVPSFTCSEHIVSQESRQGKIKRETTVDAVFSVTRSPTNSTTLQESRDVRWINGKPANGKAASLPLSFSGGFSGALTKFLSSDHRSCFDYTADTSAPAIQGTAAFTFAAKAAVEKQPGCASIQPGTSGKFAVDIESMQVTHIERTVQTAVGKDQAILGTAAVDYAPVAINGKSFWLPITITAFTTETARTDGTRFTAHYSDYHRFAATAALVPTDK